GLAVYLAAGPDRARVPVLARRAGRGDSLAGSRVPPRRRRLGQAPVQQARGGGMSLLEVKGLTKAFGGVRAVSDVTFAVEAGEILALIGPNGAGKSTCFNMLNGQLRPDGGSIALNGTPTLGRKPREVWRMGVGRTFQITATFSSMTVRENVQMALLS